MSSVQQNFIEYLTGLTFEGETPLIVRQKPQMKDGEIQLHANGAIKATWPAYLPTHTIKPDWAIYGNTALFIIDRFENGKVAASADNCDYVMVMVLDDVGDPEKAPNIPPLQPTWKMETSKGSFQWGYAFSEQPTKGEFAAAIKAIAAAGYTDPGATNPVRNFRLPESINLKPGRDNFASVLTEFDPKIEYTLEEICTAFNVAPEPADTATFRAVRLLDDGNDDVVRWLSTNSLVISKPNGQGWMGIVCPNSAEHTDGNPEGRYMPLSRAYCCLHSHCVDFGSAAFLEWVERQGGPKHSPGLREELLAASMNAALAKLTPTEAFPDRGAEIIAEVGRQEVGRVEKAEWFTRFAYIQDDDAYFDMDTRVEISRSAFNALFRHITCKSIHTNRKIEASIGFDENRQKFGAPAIRALTYASGETILCSRDGVVYGNRWKDARPPVRAGDVSLWLEHCARMIPDVQEREHVLNVMAYKVQHPEAKINHAILHGGTQGNGKDTMYAPFIWSVCGDFDKNKGLLDGDSLHSQWGYQLEAEILVLNELREPEAKERRAMANRLKPIIAAPPDMLPINRKGLHPYMMVNRLMVLAFSNDAVPIVLDSSDRRWFCTWSNAPKLAEDKARALWSWYKSGGFQAVGAWLHARDVSAFNPSAVPMMTEYKRTMILNGMSTAEEFLLDRLEREVKDFASGVIAAPFHNLRDRLQGEAPVGVKIPQGALLHALNEAGWIDMGRLSSARNSSKKQVFVSPRIHKEKFSKSELRDMAEGIPSANVVNIR